MKITGDWLERPETQAVCAALAGQQVLFVGGCVRNALLGEPVADIDLATDAEPARVVELVEAAGLKAVPTGIAHGTVTVISGGIPHEITTFRRDVQTDGRHAVVAFSGSVAEDAARRDFTMNALYADASGEVLDPLGGLEDLLARRVRFVGDAEARINEDYLRILRFFRFHACYGDPDAGIDPEGLAACADNLAGIETLSKERIGSEMRKLLGATDPAPSMAAMGKAGVLAFVLPGADAEALPILIYLEGDLPPDWLRRLAVLGGEGQTEALRLSREETRGLAAIMEGVSNMAGPAELGFLLGVERGADALLVRSALLESPVPGGWQDEVAKGAAAVFPVRASDLMPGLMGPDLGAALDALQTRWIASDFTLTRDELLG